jgi:hypothetical protein
MIILTRQEPSECGDISPDIAKNHLQQLLDLKKLLAMIYNIKYIFMFLFCCLLLNCEKKTEIFKLNIEKIEEGNSLYVEYYVVNNPPSNSNELLSNVRAYNRNWIRKRQKTIEKYEEFVQVFYKESSNISRTYKPKTFFFETDDIRNSHTHEEDKILIITIKSKKKLCNTCPEPPNYIFMGNYEGIGRYR